MDRPLTCPLVDFDICTPHTTVLDATTFFLTASSKTRSSGKLTSPILLHFFRNHERTRASTCSSSPPTPSSCLRFRVRIRSHRPTTFWPRSRSRSRRRAPPPTPLTLHPRCRADGRVHKGDRRLDAPYDHVAPGHTVGQGRGRGEDRGLEREDVWEETPFYAPCLS